MPSQLTRNEVAELLVTREQAARIIGIHVSNLDRMRAEGRIPAILNENGRAVIYFRDDILAMVGGSYRRKPGVKNKLANKPIKEAAA